MVAEKRRSEDDREHHRQDEDHHWEQHLHGGLLRALFRVQLSPVSEIGRLRAEDSGKRRPELIRGEDSVRERKRIVRSDPHREVSDLAASRFTDALLPILAERFDPAPRRDAPARSFCSPGFTRSNSAAPSAPTWYCSAA